ncbi:hypothetical protein [Nonomuraea sp. NPDC049158]|uniref:hypothetical protein n=1 Tax=Nonomuraea sp. NPDC049158 TaxID=3155649 RepID=UPI0033E56E14
MNPTQDKIMPGTVRAARTIICVQFLMTLLLNVMLFLPLAINGILLLNFFFGVGASVLLGLMILKMRTRAPWVRWAGVVIQVALAANAIVGLIGGPNGGAFAGLALAGTVIVLLLTPSSAAWFKA